MKCPYCPAQIAYLGEEHGCPWPELSSGDPPTPYDFPGTDEGSHYMAQTRITSDDLNLELSHTGLHSLKTWTEYFEAVVDGRKTFEIRKNDRDFHVGDTLVLRDWDRNEGEYTGRKIEVEVMYITDGGNLGSLAKDHVCMSIRKKS